MGFRVELSAIAETIFGLVESRFSTPRVVSIYSFSLLSTISQILLRKFKSIAQLFLITTFN